jgi:hypothetical protein
MESFSIPLPPSIAAPLPPNHLGSALAPPPPPPGKTGGAPMIDFETLPEPEAELAPPPAGPRGYRHAIPIWFSPRVLQWIGPVCLILVFVLTFLSWVGVIAGGVTATSQSAWGAAFNSYSMDPDLEKAVPDKEKDKGPGANFLLIFYVILMCITLLLAIACAVFNILPGILPVPLQIFKQWRWLILGGVTFVAFLLLALQMLIGFSLERKSKQDIDELTEKISKMNQSETSKKVATFLNGALKGTIIRTFWLRLAFTLQLLAIFCIILEIWVSRRVNKPMPKLELVW